MQEMFYKNLVFDSGNEMLRPIGSTQVFSLRPPCQAKNNYTTHLHLTTKEKKNQKCETNTFLSLMLYAICMHLSLFLITVVVFSPDYFPPQESGDERLKNASEY